MVQIIVNLPDIKIRIDTPKWTTCLTVTRVLLRKRATWIHRTKVQVWLFNFHITHRRGVKSKKKKKKNSTLTHKGPNEENTQTVASKLGKLTETRNFTETQAVMKKWQTMTIYGEMLGHGSIFLPTIDPSKTE